jgi:hypothetical protein
MLQLCRSRTVLVCEARNVNQNAWGSPKVQERTKFDSVIKNIVTNDS